ncbi:MAG: helix-turn-helix domain-containing protein [Prevotella sp.]|nr:helix-turn-helix domain-containing protein [Prevotella sp.]
MTREDMKRLKKVLIMIMALLPLYAAGVYMFKTLDARNGLNSSQINCVLKDSRGFVWLGTPAGLYRYDGYTFRNYQCNSQDGSSLPDSYISSIQESLDGNLWIQTPSGMCIYHPQSDSFERDMRQVFSKMGFKGQPDIVYIDKHKNMWMSIPKKGVMAYNMQQQLLYEFGYTDDAHGVPEGDICSISECHDGAVMVYTDGRMICCDVSHQQRTIWQTRPAGSGRKLRSASFKAFADQMDNIWLYGQGTLMVYNKNAGTWDTAIGDRIGLTGSDVDRTVNGMAGDRSGNIWIGTDEPGLIRMNVNSREMETVEPRSINDPDKSAGGIGIQSVYVDDTDLLWVGTEKSGVAFCGNNIYKFQSDLCGDITAMTQDASGKVWYGTSNRGVIGYDGPLAGRRVTAMAYTPDGSLWFGSKRGGLTRVKDGVTTIYSATRDSMRTLVNNTINDLCTDKTGNLWIATNGGLQVFNPRTKNFAAYTSENGKMSTNNITSLFYGKGNNLFIGTNEGLIIQNLSTNDRTTLTGTSKGLEKFTNNYITQVIEDSRGLIWIGTRGGVNVLDLESDHLDFLTEKEGLANNCVCGLTEDKNRNIWITTSNGITRVVVQRNHEEGTFNYGLYNYNTADGLQSNEFNPGAILTKADGNVLFGGLNGVNWIRQQGKADNTSLPRVMLTQLFIDDTEIMTGHEYDGHVPLPQSLNESTKIELANGQNTFTIKFAAGNYNQSERLMFMYWLEGRDDDWKNGDPLLHGVTFNDLSSGKYTLHVKAISANGAVSNQERTLGITILRPWWMSWWMILLYAVTAIIVIYIWIAGTKQISYLWSRKKAVIMELKAQREEIKAASDELRNPMARMTSIISNMAEKETSVEGKEQINSLHFLMLQIITRISEMQTSLENPEAQASESATNRMQLNSKGEISLAQLDSSETLTAESRPRRTDQATKKYVIVLIDDNKEFLNFVMAHLRDIYDMHAYDDMKPAMADIEVLNPDIIVCKHGMPRISGSDLCNMIKRNSSTSKTKFVLMTDSVLTSQDMQSMNITLAADDYLAKPFNIQEAMMRFNSLLGLAPNTSLDDVIEGKETRMLEGRNSSMTTATMSDGSTGSIAGESLEEIIGNAGLETADAGDNGDDAGDAGEKSNNELYYKKGETIGDYTMNDMMDRQLMMNVEQYVLHNMSRGNINLEEMASAMGMGRVPFFHKIRNITSKTPAEFVRELRLKHACTLLQRTNINMSELAITLGFMTAENFANIFKEKYGMSPLEYRIKHRKEA